MSLFKKFLGIMVMMGTLCWGLGCSLEDITDRHDSERDALSGKDITYFAFLSSVNSNENIKWDIIGQINDTNITVKVPSNAVVSNLIATFSRTGYSAPDDGRYVRILKNGNEETFNSDTTNASFVDSRTLIVYAPDGSSKSYLVTVEKEATDAKAITYFAFLKSKNNSALSVDCTGIIDEGAGTITVTVPVGTTLTDLKPTFRSTGNSVTVSSESQISSINSHNFTSNVIYTVLDGASTPATKTYTVQVTN